MQSLEISRRRLTSSHRAQALCCCRALQVTLRQNLSPTTTTSRSPPTTQALALQEPGVRPARAVPYRLNVDADADFAKGTFELRFGSRGKATAVFQVRSGDYTVGPHKKVTNSWPLLADGHTTYDLSVYGPNGFFRAFMGSIQGLAKANLSVESRFDADSGICVRSVSGGYQQKFRRKTPARPQRPLAGRTPHTHLTRTHATRGGRCGRSNSSHGA